MKIANTIAADSTFTMTINGTEVQAKIATAIKRSNNLTKFCLTSFKYTVFQSISYIST